MPEVKNEAIEMIERLPDDASMTDIMAEIYFRLKVETGLKELDEGKGITQTVARDRLKKWLSWFGLRPRLLSVRPLTGPYRPILIAP
ncbi:MAG TPA: hypothetical protein VMH22_00820 [bacterium]|nr:hypothetical protein [bacterium]